MKIADRLAQRPRSALEFIVWRAPAASPRDRSSQWRERRLKGPLNSRPRPRGTYSGVGHYRAPSPTLAAMASSRAEAIEWAALKVIAPSTSRSSECETALKRDQAFRN